MENRERNGFDLHSCLARIETKIDFMRKEYAKIIYAMLGIIAATIGIKFIGSPVWVVLAQYLTFFTSVFVLAVTIGFWATLKWQQKLVRLSFVLLLVVSVIPRVFFFESGVDVAPEWFPFLINICISFVCVALIISSWKRT